MEPVTPTPSALSPARVAIFANPFSGSGPTQARVAELVHELSQRHVNARVFWERDERTCVLRDRALQHQYRCIVAAGGDGTVWGVLNERPAVPVVAYPMGNENLFARELGYPGCGRALAEVIARGRPRRLDLGLVRCADGVERVFSLMLSAGFDADVIRRVALWRATHQGLRRVSRLSYVKPILAALRSYAHGPIVLEADGRTVPGTHAIVFNVPGYAFGLRFAPNARSDDGLLDWLVFERPGCRAVLRYAWSVARGRHLNLRDVQRGQAREIRIRAARPEAVPVQMDGEEAGTLPVDVRIAGQAISVLSLPDMPAA
jgi:diacylglycerol kinase family enzyme